MVGLGFLRVLCGGPVVFRLCRCVLGSVGFPGDGLRQFKDRRLERIHGEVDIDGVLAFFDGFKGQNGIQRGDVVAVGPLLEHHALVDFDNLYDRMVVPAGEQKQCTEQQ